MTNFSIGPTPLQIVGAGVDNEPLTVQNTGAVSIYLSADPGVSTKAFEYKIDAGGDFTWPPGKSLSVCTGPGVVGQISFGGTGNVRVNSGSTNVTGAVTINGTVPISGPVTVSGTVALNAGTVVAISGPVAISGTVPISGSVNIAGGSIGVSGPVSISGGVSVTGSTINVGTVNNNVTLLATYNTVIPANTGVGIVSLSAAQLVNYQTLIITAPSVGLAATNAATSVYIQWLDASGNVIGTDAPIMFSNGTLEYAVPIRGIGAYISAQTSPIASHNALPIRIFGSVYLLPRHYYSAPAQIGALAGLSLNFVNDSSAAGSYGLDAAPSTASTVNVYLPSNAGKCSMFVDIPSANGTVVILGTLSRQGNFDPSTRLFYQSSVAVTIVNGQQIIIPEAPLMWSIGAGTTSRAMLTLGWEMK